LLGADNFRYAVLEPVSAERLKLGYRNDDCVIEPWLLRAYTDNENDHQFRKWYETADIIMTGERSDDLLLKRVRAGKLTFYMSERWWKPPLGKLRLLHPAFAKMAENFRSLVTFSNFHYFPIGALAAQDMSVLGCFSDRIWEWGYFTEVVDEPYMARHNNPVRLLWVGRMLALKRIDIILHAASRLRRQGYLFTVDVVGEGPMRSRIRALRTKLGLADIVRLAPSIPADQVHDLMCAADIYVFPSNGSEGWGAVVNEAMSTGCLVVASQATGAATTLIRDGVNGLLFRSGDVRQLSSLIARAISEASWREQLAREGYHTMHDLWNPRVAAQRLMNLSNGLLGRGPMPDYNNGPCRRINTI